MRVLVIPEDFRNDQYLLKPLFERLFRSIGKPRARVRVCQNPLLGGVAEALKSERIREVVDQHDGMTDVFILCVDRDGAPGRRHRLDQIEAEFGHDRTFSPRTLGRRSRRGRSPGWNFLETGVGRTFARRSTSRSGTSTFWRKSGASRTTPTAAARRWGKRPHATSPRFDGSAPRTSIPSPGVSKPPLEPVERG